MPTAEYFRQGPRIILALPEGDVVFYERRAHLRDLEVIQAETVERLDKLSVLAVEIVASIGKLISWCEPWIAGDIFGDWGNHLLTKLRDILHGATRINNLTTVGRSVIADELV